MVAPPYDTDAFEDQPAAGAERMQALVLQPRLADARLSDDGDDLAATRTGLLERAAELLHLPVAWGRRSRLVDSMPRAGYRRPAPDRPARFNGGLA